MSVAPLSTIANPRVYSDVVGRATSSEGTVMERFYPFRLRHIKEPTIPLPIACRSTGHYNALAGWHNPIKWPPFVQIFWGIRGKGKFVVGGQEYFLTPGHFFVLFSGQEHDITALTDWEYCWLTLDGLMPNEVVKGFGFGNEVILVGACPQELFERLFHEIEDISPEGQRTAGATAYEILSLALRREKDKPLPDSKYRVCIDLIKRKYANPDLNVASLAAELGLHRTSLSKMFRANMTMSPVEYLSLFRIGKAVKLLQGTDLPVNEVAKRSGFSCPNYLTNVIKKRTGLTPRELRGMDPKLGTKSHTFIDSDTET